MADYRAQIAKDQREFANIARVKLREVCRGDRSSLADVERIVDLLGEWIMRLSAGDAAVPRSLCRYAPAPFRPPRLGGPLPHHR